MSTPSTQSLKSFSRIGELSGSMIETLNSECFCISLDGDALRRALESELGEPGLADLILGRSEGNPFRT